MRISIDGLAEVDEYVRNGTDWEHKLAVMNSHYENFKIECWDITLNSLSVRQGPKLIEWLRNTYPDVKINVRPHMVMAHYIYIDCLKICVHKH